MATSRQQLLGDSHRRQLRALRTVVEQQLANMYRSLVGEVRPVDLASIGLDDRNRPALRRDIVRDLLTTLDDAPPIHLEQRDGGYRLIDGRHRIQAAIELGRSTIDALVGPDIELDVAFARYEQEAAPVIVAAQASAATAAAAYLRSVFAAQAGQTIEPASAPDDIVGRTEKGLPLVAGMAALAAMVKGRIAAGGTLAEAVEFGRYLALRFADAEVVRVADATAEAIARKTPGVVRWRGVVASGACDPCHANAGEHPLEAPIYRHPHCNCVIDYVLGGLMLRG